MTEHDSDPDDTDAAEVQRIIQEMESGFGIWTGDKADGGFESARNHEITTTVLRGTPATDAPGDVEHVEALAYNGAIDVIHGENAEKPKQEMYVRLADGTRIVCLVPAERGHEHLDALIAAIDDWETLETDWKYR